MNRIVVYILAIVLLFSCKEDNYYPKPLGNFRIGFPEILNIKITKVSVILVINTQAFQLYWIKGIATKI